MFLEWKYDANHSLAELNMYTEYTHLQLKIYLRLELMTLRFINSNPDSVFLAVELQVTATDLDFSSYKILKRIAFLFNNFCIICRVRQEGFHGKLARKWILQVASSTAPSCLPDPLLRMAR